MCIDVGEQQLWIKMLHRLRFIHVCVHTFIRTWARARAWIRWRLSVQEQCCGGQRLGEWRSVVRKVKGGCSKRWRLRGRNRCICSSYFTRRVRTSERRCECINLTFFGRIKKERGMMLLREKEDIKEDVDMTVKSQVWDFSRSAETSHPFKCHCMELTRSMEVFPFIVWHWHAMRFAIEKWKLSYIYHICQTNNIFQ